MDESLEGRVSSSGTVGSESDVSQEAERKEESTQAGGNCLSVSLKTPGESLDFVLCALGSPRWAVGRLGHDLRTFLECLLQPALWALTGADYGFQRKEVCVQE